MLFKVLLQNFEELYLKLGLEVIERVLVGVCEVCLVIYSIQIGDRDGGRIFEIVAVGIDCLDLVLEYVIGKIVFFYRQFLVYLMLIIIVVNLRVKLFCRL